MDAKGSFSAAADALNYTQPAVSRLVAALEAEVGATLVDRRTRPLRLTGAGEALARRACAVFEQLATAGAEIGAILRLDAGRLQLGTFSSAGATFVAQALAAFRQRFPGVRVTVMEAGPDPLGGAVRAGDCEMTKALVAVGMGIALLPRIAIHPIHPGVSVKAVGGSPTRRILAVELPGTASPASQAFLELLQSRAAAYPALREPARA